MASGAGAPPLADVLSVAKQAALLAGEAIRGAWLQKSEVKETKSNETDLVTETDQRCEDIVISLLKKSFPTHEIIGEESAGASKYELDDRPTWTIDPIDGTTNFVHRVPFCCVIIAFLHKREPQVGVVYDPNADELFWAVRGEGTFLRRRGAQPVRVRVSGEASLQRSVISMDPGYGRNEAAVSAFASAQSALLLRGIRNIRVLGSTGLNMAYVACGRLDGGFEEGSWGANTGPKIWDFAAGKLMIQEAGGVTRDLGQDVPTSRPLDLLGRSFFCAASEALAEELQGAIADGRGARAGLAEVLAQPRKRPRQ